MNNKQITYISIEQLTHHPNNPRKDLGDLTELIDSIKQKGILQNLTVVPWYPVDEENYQKWLSATKAERETITNEEGYFVLIGNRRFEAAKSAGLTELPCIVAEVPREEQMEIMLLENMQRSDLTVYEEAEGFQMMLDLGYSADEIADKTGFARSTVYKRVDLLKLDKTGFKASVDRGATLAELIKLNKIEDEEERNDVLNKAGTKDFEYELERALRRQGNNKYLQSVVDVLKPFAKELTEDEKRRRCQYNSEGTRDLEQAAYWSTYRHTDDVTLPELEEDEKEQADAIPFSFLNNLFFEGKSLFYGTFYCYDNSQAEAYADKFAINKILINPSAKESPSLGDVNADWIIDMGPEGGAGGGTVIARGTPEEICEVPGSYTGQFLKPYLNK